MNTPIRAMLGIDTSCYTTSVAVVGLDGAVLASERQLLQVPSGGRGLQQSEMVYQHVRALPALIEKLPPLTLCALAASEKPRQADDSFMPAFLVGASHARATASLLRAPFYATDHQRGHIAAAQIGTNLPDAADLLAVHLSGGTTEVLARRAGCVTVVGQTLDISAGQLIDRIGVALGLGFPAGRELELLAMRGQAAQRLKASLSGADCHLSGAEAQAMRWIAQGDVSPADIAAEVFDLVARTVLKLLTAASERTGLRDALLAGGVASSALLRRLMAERIIRRGSPLALHWAQPEYAGDNAVGVARIGWMRYLQEQA